MSPIHISLSPNLEADDLFLSLKLLLSPHRFNQTKEQQKLIQEINKIFPTSSIYLTNSARSALTLALKALDYHADSEIILQSFTCSATVNPLIQAGLIPKYVDQNLSDFNIDSKQIAKAISKKTRAILVQHTFGTPANLKEIISIAKKHNLLIIEDCAHSLGATYANRKVGSLGDISLLSFGRDKVISSVFGGALLVGNEGLNDKVNEAYKQMTYPPKRWTIQQLLHLCLTYCAKVTYNLGLGKLLLVIFQKLNLISKAIYPIETLHHNPRILTHKLPEPLALLAINQIKKLTRFNNHRQAIAKIYDKEITNPLVTKPKLISGSIFLRYNLLTKNRNELVAYLKKKKIIVGDWYQQPITPSKDLSHAFYKKGSNPNSELACLQSLNLPTYPTLSVKQARKIVKLVNSWSL